MRVLAVSDAFTPGVRGGNTRHLINTVSRLGPRLSFWVLTRDHDVGSTSSYDAPSDCWLDAGHARVLYATRAGRSPRRLARAIAEARPDVILLNSVFSRLAFRVLVLHRMGVIRRVPILLGPEGELQTGALALRRARKRALLFTAWRCGLYRDVTWRATTGDEADDIRRVMGGDARIALAPVICAVPAERPRRPIEKQPGLVRLTYVSRITPKKNLLFLLHLLDGFAHQVELDIVGPVEDRAYWAACRAVMERVQPPVRVQHLGEAAPGEVHEAFSRAHASVLPTLGENFGFAILESLAAARPVVISPHTPWRQLAERRAGWDIPLEREAWRAVIELLVCMDATEYRRWADGALAVAREHAVHDRAVEQLETALYRLAESATGDAR